MVYIISVNTIYNIRVHVSAKCNVLKLYIVAAQEVSYRADQDTINFRDTIRTEEVP